MFFKNVFPLNNGNDRQQIMYVRRFHVTSLFPLCMPIFTKSENHKIRKTQQYMFSKCLLRHDVVRVFVSSLVLVFVWVILSWCP